MAYLERKRSTADEIKALESLKTRKQIFYFFSNLELRKVEGHFMMMQAKQPQASAVFLFVQLRNNVDTTTRASYG